MHLFKLFQVSRADIEGYTGEGELPPYREMTLRATGVREQRGDLHFGATLKGMETTYIVIERMYEQPAIGKLFLIHNAWLIHVFKTIRL